MASQKKKIIAGFDGTWLNSDDGFSFSASIAGNNLAKPTPASNVTRIHRALKTHHSSGAPQLRTYISGVGSANNNWYDHFVNGAVGTTIGAQMREGYSFIRANYTDGDEIFLFGFSRGSFCARAVGTLIHDIGLLTAQGMEHWYEIFHDWMYHNKKDYQQKLYPNGPRLSFKEPNAYRKALVADGYTRPDIPIKVIGCFDTVGTLGIPALSYFKPTLDYSFVDTKVLDNVDNCFHAIALDECRKPFGPTLWENPDKGSHVNLKQCWFPGVHCSVGGGLDEAQLSNLTLAWMINLLSPHLDFDDSYLGFVRGLTEEFYTSKGEPPRHWATGLIQNSLTFWHRVLGGVRIRHPGFYHRMNSDTGKPFEPLVRLVNTNETIHSSVRVRWYAPDGKGVDDYGKYNPSGLDDSYDLVGRGERDDPMSKGWSWKSKDLDPASNKHVIITEEPLSGYEVQTYKAFQQAASAGVH